MFTHFKTYSPYISPFDPCPPMTTKIYSTPPQLYIGYQPPNLAQFPPQTALRKGTLWQAFYDPYFGPHDTVKEGTPL